MGKATEDLRNEHEAILHVFTILDRMLSSTTKSDAENLQFGTELVNFLKIFADKCHHGKEEDLLFKELEEKGVPNEGGPIGAMLQEHHQGREYIALMSKYLESKDLTNFKNTAINYRDLLRSHIAKENNVLFIMADKLLDDKKQDELFEKFENHEETVVGHGVHEELHSRIHKWEDQYK
ncbi:MAG: hemerythrin domain-containing protein [Anaerolineaceae bacterium]